MASSARVSVSRRVRKSKRARLYVHKPSGAVSQRVEAVGGERFGIVSVDPAKRRSTWMFANFYGRVLIDETSFEHVPGHVAAALIRLRTAVAEHGIKDLIVAVERTGTYHEFPRRAFQKAGFEVRIVHPFATKQHRLPAAPGIKTDAEDLLAIHRAGVNGFGLLEQPLDDNHRTLRLLVRHRRDLVEKASALHCQIREPLHLLMPGYAALFDADALWRSGIALPLARHTGSAAAVLELGAAGLARMLNERRLGFQKRSLEKIVAWARTAAAGGVDPDMAVRRRRLDDLDDDRAAKNRQIQALERDIAACLVNTPYVLLLVIPGLNVVSAGDLAGELGPITHYANANAITGRAGLYPSRYQSDEVDRADGKLVRCANRRLRAALMRAAENLVLCNRYYAAAATVWRTQKVDARKIRVRVAKRFSRLLFAMIAGRQILPHPCCQERSYVLDKLNTFHQEHGTPMPQRLAELHAACDQLPQSALRDEARPWREKQTRLGTRTVHQPTILGEILPAILARLVERNQDAVQSGPSEDQNRIR